MGLADVFTPNAFGLVQLTQAINKMPLLPSRLKELGVFGSKSVRSPQIAIEERNGVLHLISTSDRTGQSGDVNTAAKRTIRTFTAPHPILEDRINAADVMGLRAFGSESAEAAVATVVGERMQEMKNSHDATLEWHRAGAISGNILDADGSTVIYNLFTEFGVSETTVDFDITGTDYTTNGVDVREKCIAVLRAMETSLGLPVGGPLKVHCLCGNTFFDALISHESTRTAYERWQQGEMLRNDPRRSFNFAGITFENYSYTVGSQLFIPATDARFFPIGVPQLFTTYYAPADFVETVNTNGLPLYAKQKVEDFDRGVRLHTQSNPLTLCHRPAVLIKGTNT